MATRAIDPAPPPVSTGRRLAKWLAIAVGGLVLILVGVVFGIDSGPGRRLIADWLGGYRTASGLNLRIGRIDGSIYGRMTLTDVRVSDPRGVFLTAPRLDVDWRPLAYLNRRIDVASIRSPRMTLERQPLLNAVKSAPNTPLLPDLDLDIGRLSVARLVLAAGIAGPARIVSIDAAAHLADRRAQLSAELASIQTRSAPGGDRLSLRLDAVPDRNILSIDGSLDAPVGGVVSGLAGTVAPLHLRVAGRGDWHAWAGRATGRIGAASLADLELSAHDGRFGVRGTAHPALYPGPPRRPSPVGKAPPPTNPLAALTAPALAVRIDAVLGQRRVETSFTLGSDALALVGGGGVDLGKGRFDRLKVDARLLRPGAIAPNLTGRDVALAVVINGGFDAPVVDYALRAGSIGFGGTTAEALVASGRAQIDAAHVLVPISAHAARVTGLNAAAGDLLRNVAIDGDIAIAGGKLLSDDLRIRSDRIAATAIVVADLAHGVYRGALNGRINDYRIESIGIVNLSTNAKLIPAARGGFTIAGRIVARTYAIFNDGARQFLGGNAVVRADIGYATSGEITVANLRLAAPKFQITRGTGRYEPGGALRVDAAGVSQVYGPISALVEGSAAAPVVLLKAARPGIGVGLVDLSARVVGHGSSYAIAATGGTDYGPFNAALMVSPGAHLAVDIRSARFAGVDFKGRLQQLAAGPFAGRVDFSGSGITGDVALAAQGRQQAADVSARVVAATIPGKSGIMIGRAIATAHIVLVPGAPTIRGDVQFANLRDGSLVLATARARIVYAGGSGSVQAVATGSSGVPFNIAVNAALRPALWLIAAQGRASGIDFRTSSPARVEPPGAAAGSRYRLQPVQLTFGAGRSHGSVRLAGSYGSDLRMQARIDTLDLSIINAIVPDLGIGGSATGGIDYAQVGNQIPLVRGTVLLRSFTRASLMTVSEPVDVDASASLQAAGGEVRALVRRGTTTVGRLVASVGTVGGTGSLAARLLAAPLTGGVRYNGPAGVPFSLSGLANQSLTGGMAIAADLSGRLGAPQVVGLIRADGLTYVNETFGTRLSNLKLDGRFTSDRLEISQLTATAGEGRVNGRGTIGLSANRGFPINFQLKLDNARLARSDALGATATGTIDVVSGNKPGGQFDGLISGDLQIPDARYEVIRQGQAEVPELTGVRRKSATGALLVAPPPAPPGLFRLDLHLSAANQLYVSGMGLESEWKMDLRVGGTSAAPRVVGRADVVRGTYSFAGKLFNLDRGTVTFDGGPLADPQIAISASTTVDTVSAVITIAGSGQNPQISFSSVPALPQDEIVSRLLFGSSVTNLSAIQAIQLASALNSLRGSGGGLNPLGKLRSATGIDRLRILGADSTTGRGTALAAGQYITKNIYVEIITDARGFTATQIEVALAKGLSVLSQAGSFGGSNVNVRYKRDF